jgi:hypothetical protein
MPCCSTKESKSETKGSCCERQAEEKTKTLDEAKSGCGCNGGKESAPKKEEQKTASCC